MLFLDMLCELSKVLAVEVYELAAAETFEVEMAAALLLVLDILIAGAGLAVKGVLAHKSLFDQSVQLSVDSCNAYRSTLSGEERAYLLNVGMLLFILYQICQQVFLLFCIIT